MPNAEYHQVVTDDHPDLDAAFADWDKKEGLLAAIFIDFLRRQAGDNGRWESEPSAHGERPPSPARADPQIRAGPSGLRRMPLRRLR